jgi:hypothetical protein
LCQRSQLHLPIGPVAGALNCGGRVMSAQLASRCCAGNCLGKTGGKDVEKQASDGMPRASFRTVAGALQR